MIKAVIFDLDGVIIDSLKFGTNAFIEVMGKEGYKVSEEFILKRIGIGAKGLFKDIFDFNKIKYIDSDLDNMVKKLEEVQKKNIEKLEVFDGFYELIKELNEFKTCVATSSSKVQTKMKIDKVGYKFDVIITIEDAKRSKPYPDIFLKAAEVLNLKPNECIVFEDAIYGVEAAKKAGMKCIGVTTGFFKENELKAKGADLIVNSLSETEKIIDFIDNLK